MYKQVDLYTDGGSRGNPGLAGAGFVIKDEQGQTLLARGVFLGHATNNVAEYTAVKAGLAAAKELGTQSVRLFADSQLLVRQLNGQYKVKSDTLRPYFSDCMTLLASFQSWQATHIYREQNTEAEGHAQIDRALDAGRAMSNSRRHRSNPQEKNCDWVFCSAAAAGR